MSINLGRVGIAVLAVGAIAFGVAGSASAYDPASTGARDAIAPANSVNSAAIINGSVGQADMYGPVVNYLRAVPAKGVFWGNLNDGIVSESKLAADVKAKLNATKGQVTSLEADGPYPGSTKLQDYPGNGANSTEKVPADGKSHAVWVQCADGKTALGGGFRLGADQGDAVASKIQVTASEPTQIKNGAVVYEPIAGDAAGSLEPNGWLVEVINSGDTDATVRPWITCAKVAK